MNKRGLSRMLSVLLLVVMVVSMLPVSAYADSAATWTKVDLSAITAGDTVAITMSKDGTTWVLPNTAEGSKGQPLATATGTIADNKLTTDGSSGFAWNITATEGGYNISSGGSYLYVTATNNGVRIGSTQSVWSVSSDGYLTAKDSKDAARYLGVYNNQDWRCYTNTTGNIAGQTLGFWKLDSAGEPDPDPVETVATPTASVASGAVAEGTKVSFSCETAGAKIYYKTGEGEYTEYTAPITLTADASYTVKAVLGEISSEEAVFTYTIKNPYAVDSKYSIYKLVDKPEVGEKPVLVFNPGSGRVLSSQPYNNSDSNFSGAAQTPEGYYIYVDVADTKAIEWTVGAGAEGFYTFTQGEKQLSAVLSGKFAALSVDPTNETDWALDTCSEADNTYFVRSKLTNEDGKKAYLEWYNKFCLFGSDDPTSNVPAFGMAFYQQVREGEVTSAEAPTASPAPGAVAKGTEVVLSCATEGAIILYKTAAEADFAEYTAPIVINEDTTIIAKAVKEGLSDSKEVNFAYTLKTEGKTAVYTETIADGDKVVIYYPKDSKVLSTEVYVYTNSKGSKEELKSLEGSVDGNILTYPEGTAELTVVKDKDGNFSFVTADGKYLYLDGTNVKFADTAGDCTLFALEDAANGHYIKAPKVTVGKNIQYLEYFSGYFTCYGLNTSEEKVQYYTFQFFKLPPEPENHIVTDLNELTDGAKVVIFNPDSMKALSQTYGGNYNNGVDVTNSDGKLAGYGATEIWTVGVNADGSYTFSTADGKKLAMGTAYTSMPLDAVNKNWIVTEVEGHAGYYYINNIGRDADNSYRIQWRTDKNYWSAFFKENTGEAYMQQFYLVVREEEPPAVTEGPLEDGAQVVIYNASAEGVIGLEDELGATMSCVPATIEDGKAVVGNGGRVFTVSVSGSDYSFESGGKYLAVDDTENLFLTETLDDYAKWNLEKKSVGYVMNNKAAKYSFSGGGSATVCIEYFSGSFSGWTYKSADSAIFEMNFYPVAEGTNITEGIVNKPQVVFGTIREAYIGLDYSLNFTIDAVFGLEGQPEVKLEENSLVFTEDNGVYTATIPMALLEGKESVTVTVSGVDTKGVNFSGTAEIAVLDEPVFSDLTPAAGSQTGEDKRPVISAKVTNAGEEPEITMTVGGGEVTPEYKDGVISYTPDADLPDGRTTVTISVKRADGKEASKSWAFTVGTARYQLYFGQLHSHTTYSDGSGTLDAALDYVRNLPEDANVDFVAFTDHSNYFDQSGAANPEGALYDMSLATAYSQETWKSYKDTVAAFNTSQSDIIAIAGFEMTWSGGPGHINTFNTPGIVSRNNTTLNNKTSDAGMKAYYALLSQPEGENSLSQFNHPGSTFGTFSDFAYWDALIDSRIFLVEVGNGEGQIGAGGYYPSYEYYTMALDKGWHVAPTNNQDNHKGKWGNANDARDVIITDNFSEEGIYAAIRAMRMYSTEDKNLEIGYTVNDEMMGTIISEVPEKLNISVTVNDPDASDSISKVEVIVDSGRTAYTWNDPAELATGALSVELDPDYSYYYIRVTEGDGDLAVTAPVWVGEKLKLGISSLECGTSIPVTGEELTLTTTLFNSEAADATVKSLTYTTNGSVVLGTDTTVYTLPASGKLDVDFKYTPDVAKVMTVTVTAVVELDGKEFTFTKDISLDILDANSLVYVGIDASHYNEYVAGNYKDSMGNFGALAAGYSVRTVELKTSEELIAACSNPKFAMLIFTAPSRRVGDALRDPYATYSDAEIEAITEFNSKGGAVVLCGWGDFYESYAEFPAEDHMAAQQNKILNALGSSLRISDDETKDDSWNGGQAQRLYLSSYNFASFLLDGVEYDAEKPHDNLYTELYSQYGGASIYTEGGTIPATVTPVVYGFDTTYSADDDKDSYGGLGSIPKYNFDGADRLMVMATEQLEGKGLIVVSGAAFLSNFEVQATVEDSGAEKNYSNYKICENLLKFINPVTVTDIATVRAQTEAGFKYTIEGIVTSNASGYDKDTAFFDCIYVQDATGGICCFPVAGNYKVGDRVRITGTTDFYQGEPELQVSSIELIDEGNEVTPTEVTAAQITDRSVEGLLVTLKGVVVSFEEANGLVQTIMVRDEAGNVARVFIDGYITTSREVENLAVGAGVSVTGLASYDNTFNAPDGPFPRIRIRDRADVKHVHIFSEWTVITEATCTEDGVESRGCVCGVIETRPIKAAGHQFGEWKTVKEPTDYLSGKKERVCSVCGEKETEKIPALKRPGTGDNANILFWAVTCTVSAAGTAVILVKSRKKYKGTH